MLGQDSPSGHLSDLLARVERQVGAVYEFCPPTLTHYSSDGRAQYAHQWESFMGKLGITPTDFAGKRLLDVGCGSCEKATLYHDWGAHVTGVEMTSKVIDRAQEVIGTRPIEIIHGSIFSIPLQAEFDIVVADGVLHHTGDTLKALGRCVSCLKEGGLLILGLVNCWGSFWWFGLARGSARVLGGSDFHRRAYWGRRLFGWTRYGTKGARALVPTIAPSRVGRTIGLRIQGGIDIPRGRFWVGSAI